MGRRGLKKEPEERRAGEEVWGQNAGDLTARLVPTSLWEFPRVSEREPAAWMLLICVGAMRGTGDDTDATEMVR